MKSRLIIFARFPERGRCKTRLASTMGADAALEIYRALLTHTFDTAQEAGYTTELRVTPDQYAANRPEWATEPGSIRPQGAGSLGDRMHLGFAEAFQEGIDKVVVIGTDCPQLDKHILARAFEVLETHEAVLGPAHDGGYYLLGLRREVPTLFSGIPWSTSLVLETTKTILKQENISYLLLPTLTDVDTEDDFRLVRQTQPLNHLNIK